MPEVNATIGILFYPKFYGGEEYMSGTVLSKKKYIKKFYILKMVMTWLVIMSMFTEAPLTLLLAQQRSDFSEEVPFAAQQDNSEYSPDWTIYDDETCGEPDCDCTPYWYGDDEPDNDFYGLDMDAYYMQYEPFEPFFEAPPMRMPDTEISTHADVALGVDRYGNPVPIIEISNHTELRAFLLGGLGPDDGHYRLTNNIVISQGEAAAVINVANPLGTQATQFLSTGRPGVFTGVICGYNPATDSNFTITGLRLRATRNLTPAQINAAAAAHLRPPGSETFPEAGGTIGVGFVQQAGNGAVIRNINFSNATTTDASRLAHFTTASSRALGGVVGATTGSGISSVVTIDNVHFTSARHQMVHTTGTSLGSWGGMVGQVGANTILNMRDVSVQNVELNVTGGTIEVFGGLVGSVGTGSNGGTLNITTSRHAANIVDVDTRGATRGLIGQPLTTSGPRIGGGVLGFVSSGHAAIYDTVVTSTRNPLDDPIRVLRQAGGIVGGSNARGTLRLNNVENQAWIQVQYTGGQNTVNGRVGGLVGRTAGALHIINSRNYGVVQHQNNNAVAGGLLGYAGTSAVVFIDGSRNGTENRQVLAGQTLPAGSLPGHILHRHSATATSHQNNTTAAAMGGIVGRTRGSITVTNTSNFGHVDKAGVGTSAQGNNTRIGGIIGRVHPVGGQVVRLDNVINAAPVTVGSATSNSRGSAGGVIGELMPPPRGNATITLNNVTNTVAGTITGGLEAGGIIGFSRPANVLIQNATNRANLVRSTGSAPTDAGGIIGRAGGAGLRINTAQNYGHINDTAARLGDAVLGATNSGGIIGRSTGARLHISNSYNEGNIRGNHNAGGAVGFANGNDASVIGVVNHGYIYASRNGGQATAGGIIGRSARRNMVIRDAGNFGNVRMRGNNNNADGAAGILGRSHGANTRIDVCFNQGVISGRNSAGGIVGRNQGALNITDVYNIGEVRGGTQNSARSGNGILGRRRTGTVRITRAWVSARVGGYAVATNQSGTLQQNANGSITGITFSGVFVDSSTFSPMGTGYTAANPATQVNRNGINLVDTELLTGGLLPSFRSGPWRTGIEGVTLDDKRTYPYFNWQVEGGGLQQPFFGFIRALEDREPEEGEVRRYLPVMDMHRETHPAVRFSFRNCDDFGECGFDETTGEIFSTEGITVFNPYVAGPFASVPATRSLNIARTGMTSVGLISNNGVVGFETREVSGRIIVQGYDPLFEGDPRYYIGHTQFTIVSTDASDVRLNREFFGCTLNDCPEDIDENSPGWGDTMRGIGLIRFHVNESGEIEEGLRARSGAGPGNNASPYPTSAELSNYTVVRITALGYAPVYRIIHNGDLNEFGRGEISIPMERVPFPIRVWVPQTPVSDNDIESDDLPGPPGTAGTGASPIGTRAGFPVLYNHTPGSFLAIEPVLRHTSHTAGHAHGTGVDMTNTVETGDAYPSGHFVVQNAMWGDTLAATAFLHSTTTFNQLRFEHLINRDAGSINVSSNVPGVADISEPILDLDIYVNNLALPPMHFRFVEVLGYTEDGEPMLRNLNIDGTGTDMPNLVLTIHNEPDSEVFALASATNVHVPVYASVGAGNNPVNDTNQLAALSNMGSPVPHFRVEGITENTTFSVVDTTERFAPALNLEVYEFFRWFEPLVNIDESRDDYGELLTFVNQANSLAGRNARVAQLNSAIDSSYRGDPYLIRTLIIPLVSFREVDVHVVQRIDDDLFPIPHSTLTQNGNVITGNDGVFTIRDDGFNYLVAAANGFITESRNYSSEIIAEVLAEDGHITMILERDPTTRPGYLEGFVRDRSNGYPIENATIFVFGENGEIIYSRQAATDETGFYSIPIFDIADYLGYGLAVRVMASYTGFAPDWSIHNPVLLTPDGAIADIWLNRDSNDFLLMVTLVDGETGEIISTEDVTAVLINDRNLDPDSIYWTLRDNGYIGGEIVVDYTDLNYVFVPDVTVTEADYIGSVASITLTRTRVYTVEFDPAGGEPEPENQVRYRGALVLPVPDPTRESYNFLYWAIYVEDEDGEGAFIKWDFEADRVESDMRLVAQWAQRLYDVTFEWGFGDYEGIILEDVPYGEVPVPPAEIENYTREGWTFAGWLPVLHPITGEGAVFVAQWTQRLYDVTFEWGFGDSASIVINNVPYGTTPTPPAEIENYTREGWTFAGWLPTLHPITGEGATFVAQWTQILHTITFTTNPAEGGTIDGEANVTRTIQASTQIGIPPTAVPMPGWTFTGWTHNSTPITEINISTMEVTTNLTFEANFVRSDYTVTFVVLEGGVSTGTTHLPAIFGDTLNASVIPNYAPLPGWTFNGWLPTHPEGHVVTSNITFTASFVRNSYTVTFSTTEGGTLAGAPTTQTILHGTTLFNIPTPNPDLGWNFVGWTPSNPSGHIVTGNIAFTAIFSRNIGLPTVEVLIRFFDYTAYRNGDRNPFEVRHVDMSVFTDPLAPYVYNIPERLPFMNYVHVPNAFGEGDARWSHEDNIAWETMAYGTRMTTFTGLQEGRNNIDVFFHNEIPVTVRHITIDGFGNMIDISPSETRNERAGVVFTATPLSLPGYVFAGSKRPDNMLMPPNETIQLIVQYDNAAANEIILVYEREVFEEQYYYVRHFIEKAVDGVTAKILVRTDRIPVESIISAWIPEIYDTTYPNIENELASITAYVLLQVARSQGWIDTVMANHSAIFQNPGNDITFSASSDRSVDLIYAPEMAVVYVFHHYVNTGGTPVQIGDPERIVVPVGSLFIPTIRALQYDGTNLTFLHMSNPNGTTISTGNNEASVFYNSLEYAPFPDGQTPEIFIEFRLLGTTTMLTREEDITLSEINRGTRLIIDARNNTRSSAVVEERGNGTFVFRSGTSVYVLASHYTTNLIIGGIENTVIFWFELEDDKPYEHTVTFNLGGAPGNVPETQRIPSGGHATRPANPIWPSRRFDGWFEDYSTVPFNFNDPISRNIVLTARWTLIQQPPEIPTPGPGSGPGSESPSVPILTRPRPTPPELEGRPELIPELTAPEELIRVPYVEMFRRHFVNGYPDGTFQPNGYLTRAEMMQVFFNLSNVSLASQQPTTRFTDINADAWYFPAVVYLESQGIVNGFPDGTLRPSEAITNAEFAALAVQFFSLSNIIEPDMLLEAGTHWGTHYINLGFARGWFEYFGIAETFNADAPITRAQAVALLNFYQGRIPNVEAINRFLASTSRNIFPDVQHGHWSFYEIMEAVFSRYYHFDSYDNEIWLRVSE